MSLKGFSIFSSGGHFAQQSKTLLAYLVEGHPRDISVFSYGRHLVYLSKTVLSILVGNHLGNIPVKSESLWPKGLGGDSI